MSGYINSFLIEPVVRQARRFSFPYAEAADEEHPRNQLLLQSHAPSSSRSANPHPLSQSLSNDAGGLLEDQEGDNRYERRPGLVARDRFRWSYTTQPDALPAGENAGSWFSPRILQSARYYTPRTFSFFGADNTDEPQQLQVSSPIDVEEMETEWDRSQLFQRQAQDTIDSLGSISLEDHGDNVNNVRAASTTSPIAEAAESSIPNIQHVRRDSNFSAQDINMRRRSNHSSIRNTDQGSLPREGSYDSVALDSGLPADDGMRELREKIHQIRRLALSNEEKAKKMHNLMMADYNAFRKFQAKVDDRNSTGAAGLQNQLPKPEPQRFNSLPLLRLERSPSREPDRLIQVGPNDREPTYYPSPPSTEDMSPYEDGGGDEPILGCQHYKRNVKIQCFDCEKWYTCRHCHDGAESHLLNRKMTQNMLCMICGVAQRAGEYCQNCGELTAAYYCDICKLWDNDATKSIYHCPDCGICRRGEGLGRDYIHCKKCNVCISIAWAPTHRCVERATDCDCPICGDYMFTSFTSVVAMKCGHYIHRSCYDQYMQTSYKCPICNCSATNMELQWRKLDRQIEAQPMPDQYRDTKAWVSCNDCGAKTITKYHWLGNKCTMCDSYNTAKLTLINSPPSLNTREGDSVSSSDAIVGEPPNIDDVDYAENNLVGADSMPLSIGAGFVREGSLNAANFEQRRNEFVDNSDNLNDSGLGNVMERTAEPGTSDSFSIEETAHFSSLPSRLVEDAQISESLLSHSPTSSTAIGSGSAPSPMGLAKGKTPKEAGMQVDDDYDMTDIGDELEEVEDGDHVAFWGDSISPTGWGISPPAWASPGFFATRWFKDGDENGDIEEDGTHESESEEEEDDSDEELLHEEDDLEGDDDMELLGHR